MKRIIFNLKWPWYCQIANGEKLIEYRQVKPYWHSRLIKGIRNFTGELIPKDWYAIFRLGYYGHNCAYPDIVRRIVKIDIGTCPYDGWDGEYFRIHFEKGESK